MEFKLEKVVFLKDPTMCDGCPFECGNDSGDGYCAAMEDGVYITVYNLNLSGNKRPIWCPLVPVKEEGPVAMRFPAGYGGLGNVP